MAQTYEIPLKPQAQRFRVTLGGTQYQMRLLWNGQGDGCWLLDIADDQGRRMVSGLPLVPGISLLQPYRYMGFAGALFVMSDGDPNQPITYEGLGTKHHLFWIPDA